MPLEQSIFNITLSSHSIDAIERIFTEARTKLVQQRAAISSAHETSIAKYERNYDAWPYRDHDGNPVHSQLLSNTEFALESIMHTVSPGQRRILGLKSMGQISKKELYNILEAPLAARFLGRVIQKMRQAVVTAILNDKRTEDVSEYARVVNALRENKERASIAHAQLRTSNIETQSALEKLAETISVYDAGLRHIADLKSAGVRTAYVETLSSLNQVLTRGITDNDLYTSAVLMRPSLSKLSVKTQINHQQNLQAMRGRDQELDRVYDAVRPNGWQASAARSKDFH